MGKRLFIEQWPLRQLYCYLVAGCNLHCRHCWLAPRQVNPGAPGACLDPRLFGDIISQGKALGLKGVKLTGGEPLLHPEIVRLIELVREADLTLSVETNGTLVTPELAGRLAEGGGAFVSVSLDGAEAMAHEWVRGVPGSFAAALEGIGNLVAAGLRPQLIMCVMEHNYRQMELLVRLAERVGAGSVKFNPVLPIAGGERLHREGKTPGIRELVALGDWVEQTLAPSAGIPVFYHHPPAFRPLSRMFDREEGSGCGSCGIFGVLGVLADGSYALCGIGELVPELVFGNAARDSLEEVWRGSPVLQEIRRGLPARLEGVCARCLLKGVCLGGCIAQNYYAGKSLWAPFWYCREAWEQGLFPQSRLRPEAVPQ